MPLLLGQLVYTSFPVVGFRTLASAQVPRLIQQAFMQKVVYQYWNSYNPPGLGYRAVYLHQLTTEHTLFGWLYNDGTDDMGRSHVPYFVCYYLAEQLHAEQLEIIFTCLHRGPVGLIDRQSPPVALETAVASDLWSYQPARMGVAIPADVRERSHIALKQRKLLDLFDQQATVTELNGQTYEQQTALSVHTHHFVVEGIETGVADIDQDAAAIKTEVLEPYPEYQKGLQLYEQVLVDAVEHECPLSDRTRVRLKLLQQAAGLKDEDIASIQARITRQRKAVPSLDQASESTANRSTSRRQAVTSVKSLDAVAVREKPASTKPATRSEKSVRRVIPARRNFRLLIGAGIAAIVALAGAYGLRQQWQGSRSPQVVKNLQPGVSWQNVRDQTLSGHLGTVWSVAISPNGQTLASGSSDHTIKIWNLSSGKLLHTVSGHLGTVWSVAISPNGQTLASGSSDHTIKIWNLSSGKLLHTFSGHSDVVRSIAISPNGQTLASGSSDHTIKIWNLSSGKLLHTFSGHSDVVRSIAISPDGQTLASGSSDNTIKIWNLSSGKLLHTFSGHTDRVISVAISPNGQTLASGSVDKTIKIWNLSSGKLLRTLSGHSDWVNSVAISPDGQIASGIGDITKIWDLNTGELLHTLSMHSSDITSVSFSATGKRLASGSQDKTIMVWR